MACLKVGRICIVVWLTEKKGNSHLGRIAVIAAPNNDLVIFIKCTGWSKTCLGLYMYFMYPHGGHQGLETNSQKLWDDDPLIIAKFQMNETMLSFLNIDWADDIPLKNKVFYSWQLKKDYWLLGEGKRLFFRRNFSNTVHMALKGLMSWTLIWYNQCSFSNATSQLIPPMQQYL